MIEVLKDFYEQSYSYRASNITLIKSKIEFDTAVNPSSELPSIDTYDLETYQYLDY